MKRTYLIVAVLLAASIAGAEDLRILVLDRELDMPLEGVRLSLTAQEFAAETMETDADGRAVLVLPEGFRRGTLHAQLPGYENLKRVVSAGDGGAGELVLGMSIAGILEGAELVVERSAPGTTDAKPGISVAMEARELKTTAFMGMVEDIMSSVGTLPGVGYSGGWGSQPSVRGGYPSELGTVLDGVYVTEPWHWGGAYSIFNPNMVESFKMSHGIFSARYGRAMSGLLEVTTKTADTPVLRVDGGISSTATDLFLQLPLGAKSGLFLGGKVTYLESLKLLNAAAQLNEELDDTIPVMPYIRDFYAKGYYAPSPSVDLAVNAFVGSDGIGVEADTDNEGIRTHVRFDWMNILGFASAALRWTPAASTAVRLTAAYNNNTADMEFEYDQSGGRKYSQAFLDQYGWLPGLTGDSYDLGKLGNDGYSKITLHQAQGKLELDRDAAGIGVLGIGAEGIFQFSRTDQRISGRQETWSDDRTYKEFKDFSYASKIEGNRILNSAAFAVWEFGDEQSTLKGEAGLRGEHFYLWNDGFDINTYPVANPRLNAAWVPLRDRGVLESLTLSAGSGFFSMFPIDAVGADKDMGIEDFEVGPDRAWFQVAGINLAFAEGVSFQLEGYYKRYFNRLYVTGNLGDDGKFDLKVNTDGIGYAAGFDLMLQRKNGRRFDGYLSYSFTAAQYKNPTAPAEEDDTTLNGEPLDRWYYPSFHRFHTLNLVLNWKPLEGWTFTAKAAVASGAPKKKVGDIYVYPARLEDGTWVERYGRTEVYDPSGRTQLSCPVDLRIAYQTYKKGSKLRREFYVGAEDVFTNLYSPKGNKDFDPFTGKELEGSSQADFGIGMPIISFGYKISY